MRTAVLDLGSNTFHLLVADVDAYGIRAAIFDRKIPTRLGEHAFDDHRIGGASFARGLAAVDELVADAHARAGRCRVIATSVFRDTANGAAFLAEATRRTGQPIELLSGPDEARLTWLGVSSELAGSHGRLAVLDLGGGSLEIAVGDGDVEDTYTLPLGVLRLHRRAHDEIRRTVVDAVRAPFRELAQREVGTVALASGTARALLRLARRLGYIAEGQRHIWSGTLGELARSLAPMPPESLLSLGVDASRTDTIATGALVLATALEQLRRPVVYIARGALREGALVDLATRELALVETDRVPPRAVPAH